MIREISIPVTTTGVDGSGAGNATSDTEVNGHLLDIYLDYAGTAPNTTDVTITHETPSKGNLLVVANNATDGLYAPRDPLVDTANSAITNSHGLIPLNGYIKVAVAQSNALAPAVTAHVRYVQD